jgi:multisubunit Na+/H+ antiporter MnhB subunit
VDCHNAHKGLGAGILVLVFTIISLVLFLVLHDEEEYMQLAVYEVSLCEMAIYLLCGLAVLVCMLKIRRLPAGRSLKLYASNPRSRHTWLTKDLWS